MKVHPGTDWRPSRDGPWPSVETRGQLAPAEREWLHTNGAGAYSMSTIAVMHTRRYHGIFVAALPPPLGPHVILSHAESTITVESEKRSHRLSTHQFPGVAPTPGYRSLLSFSIDPIPRWIFQINNHTLERSLCLARGKNTLVIAYQWNGRGPARLQVRPLMPLRPVDRLVSEHGSMVQVISLKPRVAEMQPVAELPPVVFGHEGMFMGSPDWWRRFEYLVDRSEGKEFQEDIWTPGVFEMTLEPGRPSYLTLSVGVPSSTSAEAIMEETKQALLAQDPGEDRPASVRVLSLAAEQFCLELSEPAQVLAGYPQHPALVRDWVMALPGLFLAREKLDALGRVLASLLPAQRGGLLPELLPEAGRKRARSLPDATLWLFDLARELERSAGIEHPILKTQLFPSLVRAFLRFRRRSCRLVWLSHDSLIVNGAPSTALTWMDAHVGRNWITPRSGIAVEQQALWTSGTETLSRLARAYGHERLADLASIAAERARLAFRSRFWCERTDYPYDCVSEEIDTEDAWSDDSIRPNALIALAVDPVLFEPWQAQCIVERVRAELLTPHGIRSLSPADARFVAQFAGSIEEREPAYHQGTAWIHLLGCYARAALRLAPDDMDVYFDLRGLLEQAVDCGVVLGQVPQIADGSPPHRLRGCPAQAGSVAELLRALVIDLDV